MKLIQQAYEDKHQSLLEEVNTWKWISEEQSAQVHILHVSYMLPIVAIGIGEWSSLMN